MQVQIFVRDGLGLGVVWDNNRGPSQPGRGQVTRGPRPRCTGSPGVAPETCMT